MLLIGAALSLGASCHAVWAASPPAEIALAAHRAIYDLSLLESSGEQSASDASGRIAYEFTGSACAGYTTNFRQVTEIQPGEGSPHVSDMRSKTFESGDAKLFRFETETIANGGEPVAVEGTATKTKDGVSIALRRPQAQAVQINQNVVFPTEQIVRIIHAAEAGEHTLPLKIFDGSDTGTKVYNTLAVIGSLATKAPTDKAAQTEPLRSMRRWPVTVSYFDEKKGDGPPEYVLSFDLYENGVSGSLKLNYGSFALRGEMTDFKPLPQTSCGGH
jgi:hypothetical protein